MKMSKNFSYLIQTSHKHARKQRLAKQYDFKLQTKIIKIKLFVGFNNSQMFFAYFLQCIPCCRDISTKGAMSSPFY